MVFDFARGAKGKYKDGDDADDDKCKKGPALQKDSESAESDGDDSEADVPSGVMTFCDIFFCFPRNGR